MVSEGLVKVDGINANHLDVLQVLVGIGSLNLLPSLLDLQILDTKSIEHALNAVGSAVSLAVAALATSTADLEWAVGSTVTWLLALAAGAIEVALDAWVWAVGLHVAVFAAVEAASAAAATFWLVWAVAGEVVLGTTAKTR